MLLSVCLISAFVIFIYMTAVFFLCTYKNDLSLVDIFWGTGFIVVWFFSHLVLPSTTYRSYLTGIMVLIWGLRLTLQIAIRKIGKPEDPRYTKMRAEWGTNFLWQSYLKIFMIQGVALFVIAFPLLIINSTNSQAPLNLLDGIGIFIWTIGLICEAVADLQLYRFLSNPLNRGKIMTQGIWRYSRHPNYFGEICIWWGIFLIALNAPLGLGAIMSPLLITYLLVYVSGIPPAEAQLAHNPDFKDYQEKTSILIPWIPRS